MIRCLRILQLQNRKFWQETFVLIERGRILDATRNLAEMERRLARTNFELDMLHSGPSLIIQALERSKRGT